jgi:hypothetical protein
MSSLLVFTIVYRLEIQVSHIGIFDPSCEIAPLSSHWFIFPPSPLPCVNKYRGSTMCNVGGGGGIGYLRQMNTCRQEPLLVNF